MGERRRAVETQAALQVKPASLQTKSFKRERGGREVGKMMVEIRNAAGKGGLP